MVEIPHIIERWRRKDARKRIDTIIDRGFPTWANQRDKDEHMRRLHEEAYGVESVTADDTFDRDSLQALKQRLARG